MVNETSNHVQGLAQEIGKRLPFSSLRQEAYLNLVRTQEVLAAQLAQLFKQYGISDAQYNALRILRGNGSPMQVYEIAAQMICPRSDISRLIDRLANAGWVVRERSDEDRRVVWVSLARRGKTLLKKLDQPLRELHDSQFADLTERDLEKLNDLLVRSRKT